MVPKASPCSAPRLVPAGACGELGDRVLMVLLVGPGAGLGEVALAGGLLRVLGHLTLPNMFTRSRSATTIGSRVPSAVRSSWVDFQRPNASQAR